MKLGARFVFKLILNLFCLAGLVQQIIQTSDVYFHYKTRTVTKIFVTTRVFDPALHTCHRVVDIFDIDRWNQLKRKRFKGLRKTGLQDDVEAVNQFFREVTIQDMFRFTPSTEDLMIQCHIRRPNEYLYEFNIPKVKCYEFFKISKYFHREFMCYHFQLTEKVLNNDSYSINEVMFTQSAQSSLFSVILNRTSIRYSDYFTTFAQMPNSNHLYTSGMTDFHWRRINRKTFNAENNFFTVTYHTARIKMQPTPYETRCLDFGKDKCYYDGYYECLNQVLSQKISQVVVSYPIYDENLRNKLLLPSGNQTSRQAFFEAERECYERLGPFEDTCDMSGTISSPSARGATYTNSLLIELSWPKSLGFEIIHEPIMNFIDFFVYIFSAFGTWYGFSFFGFASIIQEKISNKRSKVSFSQSFVNRVKEKVWLMDFITTMVDSKLSIGQQKIQTELEDLRTENMRLKRLVGTKERMMADDSVNDSLIQDCGKSV